MEELVVSVKEMKYPIHIGYNILGNVLPNLIRGYSAYFIISHEFLIDLYKRDLNILEKEENIIFVPVGEKSKSFKEVIRISRELVKKGADRKSILLAFGGGVIGDLTGFIASIYMRGIDFIQIPTTLLSQVDSSIGGKTGINIPEGKNLIGSFYHPIGVVIDIKTLETLSAREYISGIAEIIKYGMIMDYDFFEYLERNHEGILKRDPNILNYVIRRSLECKKFIVERDEKESNLRMILNFGHTFGHAIEAKGRYKRFLHGEAVSIGMVMASKLASKLGFCDSNVVRRLVNLLRKFNLPLKNPYRIEDLIEYMKKDKKSYKNKFRFILPVRIGEVRIVDNLDLDKVVRVLKEGDRNGE